MSIINVKFDVYFKRELGTLFKSNEVDLDGLEANVNLDLDLVESMKINYLINGTKLTDDITIKDEEKRLILIPFKSEVRVGGEKIQFEIQANMKNGDVKVSQTYAYDVEMGIGEGVQVGTGGSGDGHTHSNLSTLNKVTESKLREWDNKSSFSGSYNDLTNKPADLATQTYVNQKIAEASLSGGEVDLSDYATKNYVNESIRTIELTPGPKGDKGDVGPQGIQGPKGDKGEPGTTSWNDLEDKPIDLATESYVQAKIAEASLSGGDVDLSAYATIELVNQEIKEVDDKITILSSKLDDLEISGNITFRDVVLGEIFDVEGGSDVIIPPAITYGNIILSTTSLSFDENTTTTFTVKLDKAPTDNQVVKLSVSNAYCTLNKSSLTFTSSNYSVAQTVTVSGVHDSTNYSNKTSLITLSSTNVSSKTISVTIENIDIPPVTTIPVTGVTLNQSAHNMKVDETIQLTATVSPNDATNKNVIWSASNSNATVVNGFVTGKQVGECTITATTADGNKTATCALTIMPSTNEGVDKEFGTSITNGLTHMYNFETLTSTDTKALDLVGTSHFTYASEFATDGGLLFKNKHLNCGNLLSDTFTAFLTMKVDGDNSNGAVSSYSFYCGDRTLTASAGLVGNKIGSSKIGSDYRLFECCYNVLCVTWDHTSKTMTSYINGLEITTSQNTSFNSSDKSVYLSFSSNSCTGTNYNFFTYDRVLSYDEILTVTNELSKAEDYSKVPFSVKDNLLSYYDFTTLETGQTKIKSLVGDMSLDLNGEYSVNNGLILGTGSQNLTATNKVKTYNELTYVLQFTAPSTSVKGNKVIENSTMALNITKTSVILKNGSSSTTSFAPNLNTKNIVAISVNKLTKTAKIYHNGVLKQTQTFTDESTIQKGDFYMLANDLLHHRLVYFDRVLSDNEVSTITKEMEVL